MSERSETQSRSIESEERSYAWQIAMFLGYARLIDWIEDGVEDEKDPYRRYVLLTELSLYSLTEIPKVVCRCLEPSHPLTFTDQARVLEYIGAAKLVGSSSNLSSLEMLINSGGEIDGHPLTEPVSIAADLAVHLIPEHHDKVLALIQRSLRTTSRFGICAASQAVLHIPKGIIEPTVAVDIGECAVRLATDPGIPDYIRAEAVRVAVRVGDIDMKECFGTLLTSDLPKEQIIRTAFFDGLLEVGMANEAEQMIVRSNLVGDAVPLKYHDVNDQRAFAMGKLLGVGRSLELPLALDIIRSATPYVCSELLRGITVNC